MKLVLGLAVLFAAASPALAVGIVPAPELAGSIPAVLAVVGTYVAARRMRRRK